MEIIIKNKLLSIGGNSTVKDVDGNDILDVKGTWLTGKKKKTLYSLDGEKLYIVKKKMSLFVHKRACIKDASGNKIAMLHRRLAKFDMDSTSDEYSVNLTNILKGTFDVCYNGELIASIKRKIVALVDTFSLTCEADEHVAFLVAIVIAIDSLLDRKKK